MSKHQRSTMPKSRSAASRASSMASQNASASIPRMTEVYGEQVSSAYRICCARHVAGDLVGEHPDVLGRADEVDHRQVDVDEVREVGERGSTRRELVGSFGTGGPRCRLRELGHDARRRGADVVDVELGLGQSGDENMRGRVRTCAESSALATAL